MQDVKRCSKCGKRAIATVNDKVWLCDKHAKEATIFSLEIGQPVIWTNRGDPQYLLVPIGSNHKALENDDRP